MIDRKRLPIMGDLKPFSKFIFSSVMVFSVGLVFQLISTLIASVIFHTPIMEIFEATSGDGSENIAAMKFIQILGGLGTFVFSSFIVSFLYTGSWFAFFSFNIKPGLNASIIIVLIMISALPSVNFLTELNLKMEIPFEGLEKVFTELQDQTEAMMMKMLKADNVLALLVNIFMIAIIPAVGEELVFRGLLQKHLTAMFKNVHLAVVLAAAIFSIVHMQVYAFLPRFFLGLILGYMFFYGKSIWYPMIAHLVNNFMGVMFYYYQTKENVGGVIEEVGTQTMMPFVSLISLIAVGLLMYYLINVFRSNQSLQLDRE